MHNFSIGFFLSGEIVGDVIVVLQVAREIVDDVREQIGEPAEVISYLKTLAPVEFPKVAVEVYKKIVKYARESGEVSLVLSCPIGLAFQIGQLIGLGKYRIQVYQYIFGKYLRIPPLTRYHLKYGE